MSSVTRLIPEQFDTIFCAEVERRKREELVTLGFAYLMTRVQALERIWDRSNSTTERMAKLSSSDEELDGIAKVGYYGIGPLSDVV